MKKNLGMLALIMAFWFTISFITNILGPLIPDIIHNFNLSDLAMAGFIPTSFFIAYAIMSIPAGLMIDRFGAQRIINTGIAGAIHHDLKVLDVVVSRELCYHDYNARFLRDYPPYIDSIRASDLMIEAAVEAFEAIDHGSSCCFVGKIASGDQFIESSEVKNKIVEEHHPMCVEMEGAAIGHACTVNDIPFVIIRTMSDNADENAADSATNFEEVAAKHSAGIVLEMLSRCKD